MKTQSALKEVAVAEIAASQQWALNGGPFGSKLVSSMYVNEGVPVIRGGNLPFERRFLDREFVFVNDDKARELRAHTARPGDIIITQRGTLGQVGIILQDARFDAYIISQSQMKLTVDPSKADASFVYYCFRDPGISQRFIGHASTSGVPHVNLQTLRDFRLALPPLDIQRRIAGILGAYDDLIEVNRRRVAVLEAMARGLFEEWFVRLRFPGHETHPLHDTPNGPLPEGWRRVPFGDIAENLDRYRRPLSGAERAKRPGPFPYYGAAKIFDHINSFLFEGLHLLIAEDGSVITPEGFPVLQLVTGKFWVNNHAHIVRGRGDVSTEFLYLALSRYPIQGHITGAAQPKITQANLNRIDMLVADGATMQSLNEAVSNIIKLVLALGETNSRLAAARDLLLPRLISGQLDLSTAERELEAAA